MIMIRTRGKVPETVDVADGMSMTAEFSSDKSTGFTLGLETVNGETKIRFDEASAKALHEALGDFLRKTSKMEVWA